MQILIVRHGQSVGNAEGRMQGHRDYPLSDVGRDQARRLGGWLAERRIGWDIAYCSPLARARETAELLAECVPGPAPSVEPNLAEVRAGSLEGLTRDEILERHPGFLERPITSLADFAEFGGESYDDVQTRVRDLVDRLEREHRGAEHRVLLVGHGGIDFQIVKRLICEPVPRVCILRMGNCTATLVRMRERRGVHMGEVVWHVPLELLEPHAVEAEGTNRIFR
jgi:broad specificity phosphatase PhoE